MKEKHKQFLPNILTLTNMFLGFLAIALLLNNDPVNAGIAVIFAGMLDVFDGKIARLLGIESKFGMEFDSMADTVSFCVSPSLMVYSTYVEGLNPLLALSISFMPLMFGTIRLARNNLNQSLKEENIYNEGLTTPIAALALFSYLFFNQKMFNSYGDPRTALLFVALISLLMVSPIPFPQKFPQISFKYGRENSILLLIAIFSLIGIIIFQGLLLFPIIILFLSWNMIHWLIHSQKKYKHSKLNH